MIVLVTGASSGIGRSTAIEASRRGDAVVLAARDRTALESVAAECPGDTLVVPTDVGSDDEVAHLVERTLERYDRIDVVIANAGVVSYGRAEDVPVEVFDGVLRTNLLGCANVARHVVPVLRRQQGGTLLFVGSVLGHTAVPSLTPYVVSKWGVRALARQLRLENRDLPGLRISYVAPGGVTTPIYDRAANYGGWAGRPPPPYSSPEKVARQVLARVRVPYLPAQLTPVNQVLRFGFTFMGKVYDHLVGPLAARLTVDHDRPVGPTSGNVLR